MGNPTRLGRRPDWLVLRRVLARLITALWSAERTSKAVSPGAILVNDQAHLPQPRPEAPAESAEAQRDVHRRGFLGKFTTGAMIAGLAACYGTFFAFAGRFLFPPRPKESWLFVAHAGQIVPGQSVEFVSPAGVSVTVRRDSEADTNCPPAVADFMALSNVCPHLGCRVYWEPQNDRFFCPCHNGTFDPDGNATGGPPLAAHQHLPRYPLRLANGLLFIEMPSALVGAQSDARMTANLRTLTSQADCRRLGRDRSLGA